MVFHDRIKLGGEDKMRFSRLYVITGLVIAGALTGFIPLVRSVQEGFRQPLDGGKAKGPANARIQIHEFSDFQCPACQNASAVMEKLFHQYQGRLRLVFHHFPLKMHAWAMPAHQSAECAAMEGKFWPYHDLLFSKQKEWSVLKNPKEAFRNYAAQVGLDSRTFDACLDQNLSQKGVLDDAALGNSRSVRSTPTFFVNDRVVIGGKDFETRMEKIIKEELQRKTS